MLNKKYYSFLASQAGRGAIMVVIYLIVFGIVWACMEANNDYIVWCAYIACGYFGWKMLGTVWKDIPEVSNDVLILFLVLKVALSIVIGAFVMPYTIAQKISKSAEGYIEIGANAYQNVKDNHSSIGADGTFDPFAWALDGLNYEQLLEVRTACEPYMHHIWDVNLFAYADDLDEIRPGFTIEGEKERRRKEALPEGTRFYGCETYGDVEAFHRDVMGRMRKLKETHLSEG